MPLRGKVTTQDSAARKAADTFSKLDRDFGSLPSTTEVISFRVPKGETNRLKIHFARQGLTLAEGIKKAVYEAVKRQEGQDQGSG